MLSFDVVKQFERCHVQLSLQEKFLKDNRSYEEDGSPNMSEPKEWMTNMSCVKIELDGATDLESNADIIVNNWSGIVE